MGSRWLYTACTSGLGDRLLSLAGCWRIAGLTNRQPRLYWEANDRCNCAFGDLFESSIPLVTEADLLRLMQTHYAVKFYNAWLDRPQPLYTSLAADGDPTFDIIVVKSWNYPALAGEADGHALRQELRPHLLNLRPVPSITAAVDSFRMPAQTIGVHIRRGDAVERFRASEEEHFETIMDAVLTRDPAIKFFLATDVEAVERRFRSRYGERVLTHVKHGGGRTEKAGMADSLVDLLLLSRTKAILGNQHSSFTRVATLLGNRPLVLASAVSCGEDLARTVTVLT